jgi:hypothetical protein
MIDVMGVFIYTFPDTITGDIFVPCYPIKKAAEA